LVESEVSQNQKSLNIRSQSTSEVKLRSKSKSEVTFRSHANVRSQPDNGWEEGTYLEGRKDVKKGRTEGRMGDKEGRREGRKEGTRERRNDIRKEGTMEGRKDGWKEARKQGRKDGTKQAEGTMTATMRKKPNSPRPLESFLSQARASIDREETRKRDK
jgi:hypothetical protein